MDIRVLGLSLVLCASACSAKHTAVQKPAEPVAQQQAKQPSMEEVKAAWEKAGKVQAEHAELKKLAGRWSTVTKAFMEPGQAPEVSKGTAENKLILGGRVLEESFRGKMNKQAFEGRGLVGFDTVQNKYVSTWTDTMYTGMLSQKGTLDKNTNTFTYSGEYADPVSGEPKKSRSVLKIANNNQHTFEMFELAPNGQEFKSLEVTYTRQK